MTLSPLLAGFVGIQQQKTFTIQARLLSEHVAPNAPIFVDVSVEAKSNETVVGVYHDDGMLFTYVDGCPVHSSLDRMNHHMNVRQAIDDRTVPEARFGAGRSHKMVIALEVYDDAKLSPGQHTVKIEARGSTRSGVAFRELAEFNVSVETMKRDEIVESLRRNLSAIPLQQSSFVLASTIAAPESVVRSLWPTKMSEAMSLRSYTGGFLLFSTFKTKRLREDQVSLGFMLLRSWKSSAEKARDGNAKRESLDYADSIQHALDRG